MVKKRGEYQCQNSPRGKSSIRSYQLISGGEPNDARRVASLSFWTSRNFWLVSTKWTRTRDWENSLKCDRAWERKRKFVVHEARRFSKRAHHGKRKRAKALRKCDHTPSGYHPSKFLVQDQVPPIVSASVFRLSTSAKAAKSLEA